LKTVAITATSEGATKPVLPVGLCIFNISTKYTN
jgi:hypothetical protein